MQLKLSFNSLVNSYLDGCRQTDKILSESIRAKDIKDFLIQDPETEKEKSIVEYISSLKKIEKETEVYRGISLRELKTLIKTGKVQSLGQGMTRKNSKGSYVSDSIQLAGRFAYRAFKDFGGGYILILNRKKLEPLKKVDEGNYITGSITLDSVEAVVDLNAEKILYSPDWMNRN